MSRPNNHSPSRSNTLGSSPRQGRDSPGRGVTDHAHPCSSHGTWELRICFGLFLVLGLLLAGPVTAQDAPSERRQVELGLGLVAPQLHGGTELLRARELREQERSYFEGADGSRRSVGSYPRLFGFSVHLGFQHPVERVEGLTLGAAARTALTGSQPSGGGYSEGYFFNSVTLALAARHYPFRTPRLFLAAELGLGSVLTKNRYQDEAGVQGYFHQFGIGPSGSAGIGYSLRPRRDGAISLDI